MVVEHEISILYGRLTAALQTHHEQDETEKREEIKDEEKNN